MTNDEMDRAIAEAVGWKLEPLDGRAFNGIPVMVWVRPDGERGFPIPRYSEDLNAIHEAEKVILQNTDTGYDYDCNMNMVCETWEDGVMNYMKLWHATAAQRAEAFLRTIGKWRDE